MSIPIRLKSKHEMDLLRNPKVHAASHRMVQSIENPTLKIMYISVSERTYLLLVEPALALISEVVQLRTEVTLTSVIVPVRVVLTLSGIS